MRGAAAVVIAYAIGAVPVGFLVARAFGVGDIRRQGSGNVGATNVLRIAGWVPALLTLGGDIVKGWGAVWLGARLGGGEPVAAGACVLAAVVGNCWSAFLRFRGGKGVATGFGALLGLVPWAVVPAVPVWLAVALTTRFVSLGSILAAACVPVGALLFKYPASSIVASLAVALLIIARHYENVGRLLSGTERRLGERRSQSTS